ncbi:unnamed protein product, partial [Rotaria sp. Silwood2]
MIEHAYERGIEQIELDEFVIDLKRQIQISKQDSHEQCPVERLTNVIDTNSYVRIHRFVWEWPQLIEKSFNPGPNSFLSATGCDNIPLEPRTIWRITDGIRELGVIVGKAKEAEYIAEELKQISGIVFGRQESIIHYLIRLYTMDSFLYKVVNHVMRNAEHSFGEFATEQDKTYARLLGPYCGLLSGCLKWCPPLDCHQAETILYRSANVTDKMIESYKQFI